MKKKKAFTLIELLAVILILAILALIVSPIIMGVVESANKESAARSLEGYAEAVNNAIAQYALNNKGKMPKELSQVESYIEAKNKENVTVKKLKIEKGTVKSITAIVGDYKCTYNQNAGAECIEIDTTPTSLIMSPKNSELADTIGISTSCIFGKCTEEEMEKLSEYITNTYNITYACFLDYNECAAEDNAIRNQAHGDFAADGEYSMVRFYGIGIEKFISTIEFTKEQPSSGEIKDISEAQDGSVLLYSIPTEDDKIDIKIYSKNKIKLPSDSFYFFCAPMLTSIEFNNMVDTSDVEDFSGMFMYCQKLTSLDLSNFDTSNAKSMAYMFTNCRSLTDLDISSFDTGNVTNMDSMFECCSGLASLDLSHFDTSNVTNMSGMFGGLSLESLDLSNFNTNKVTDIAYMFANCHNLKNINLSSFNTSKVTSMTMLFYYCSSLTSLDLSNFNTSNVIGMDSMFSGCSNLSSLNVSSFNTSKVTDFNCIFYGCSGLTELNVSNFDTSNAESIRGMFSNCSGLTNIDISSFNTSKVTNMQIMFQNCSNLEHIYVSSNWDTSAATKATSMFTGCSKLPNFVSSKVDKTNANTSSTGYLTLKTA